MKIKNQTSSAVAERRQRDRELVRLVCEEQPIPLDHLAELAERPIVEIRRDVRRLEREGLFDTGEVLTKDESLLCVTPTRAVHCMAEIEGIRLPSSSRLGDAEISAAVERKQRDRALMRFVCEERQIRLDHLAELAKRPIAEVQCDVDRLEREGFFETEEVLDKDDGLPWVTPTKTGLRRVRLGSDLYRTLPGLGDLNHTFLVAATRIHYASRLKGWRWISERLLSLENGRIKHHLPDGVLKRGKKTIAIEIELTNKKPSALAGILKRLSKRHTKVHYHCSKQARGRVEKELQALGLKNVLVFDLPVDHLWFPERGQIRDE